MEDDSKAYDAVVAAYRLPKASDDEKAARKAAVQSALRGAAEVPLDVMRACQAGLAAAVDVARHGNPFASSDVGVALELLTAGLRGAALNVQANLGSIDDAGWVAGVRSEVEKSGSGRAAARRRHPRGAGYVGRNFSSAASLNSASTRRCRP